MDNKANKKNKKKIKSPIPGRKTGYELFISQKPRHLTGYELFISQKPRHLRTVQEQKDVDEAIQRRVRVNKRRRRSRVIFNTPPKK